jgi:hypothetical protein
MLIFELFDSSGGELMDQMRQDALDVITPFLAQDVPFITINQIIDGLKSFKLGIVIDRSLIMQLLDPDTLKAIDRIEGDRIYLTQPEDATREVDAKDQQKDMDHVNDMAQNQAKKQVNQN